MTLNRAKRALELLRDWRHHGHEVSAETWVALTIFLIAVLLRIAPVGAFSNEFDEGVYIQSLRAMHSGSALYSSLFYPQPPFFALAIYPFYALLGQSLPAARIGIICWSLLAIPGVFLIARALAGRWAGLGAALLLTLDHQFTQSSQRLQAEAPSLGMGVLGVGLIMEAARRTGSTRQQLFLAGGALLGLGVSTKLFVLALLVPAVLYAATPLLTSMLDEKSRPQLPRGDWLRVGFREAWPDLAAVGAGLLIALFVTWGQFILSGSPIWEQVVAYHNKAADQGAFFANIEVMAHWLTWGDGVRILAVCGFAAIIAIRRQAWSTLPIWLWLLASFVELLRLSPLFAHHLALLAPPLAVLLSVAVVRAVSRQPRAALRRQQLSLGVTYGAIALIAVVAISQGTIAVRDTASAVRYNAPERLRMALDVQQLTLSQDEIVTDDPYVAMLADRDVPPQVVEISHTRISSGYLTATTLENVIIARDVRFVLFASGRLDTVPGFRAWVESRFKPIAKFSGDNVLYQRAPTSPVPV